MCCITGYQHTINASTNDDQTARLNNRLTAPALILTIWMYYSLLLMLSIATNFISLNCHHFGMIIAAIIILSDYIGPMSRAHIVRYRLCVVHLFSVESFNKQHIFANNIMVRATFVLNNVAYLLNTAIPLYCV